MNPLQRLALQKLSQGAAEQTARKRAILNLAPKGDTPNWGFYDEPGKMTLKQFNATQRLISDKLTRAKGVRRGSWTDGMYDALLPSRREFSNANGGIDDFLAAEFQRHNIPRRLHLPLSKVQDRYLEQNVGDYAEMLKQLPPEYQQAILAQSKVGHLFYRNSPLHEDKLNIIKSLQPDQARMWTEMFPYHDGELSELADIIRTLTD